MVTLDDVHAAARVLAGHLADTPCLPSRTLSEICGASVTLKFENLQFTASFKERGALVKLSSLTPIEAERGVIAVSAGNHAQAVAYHAQRMGIPAVIVMPESAPLTKIERVRHFGAEIVLDGADFDAACAVATRIGRERNLTLVHPFNDEKIIAGQGTVALEVLEAAPDTEVLIVPIGGGGLISGIAIAAKAIDPKIEVIGVQTDRYPSMYNVVKGEHRAFGRYSIADGIAVKDGGDLTRRLVAEHVNDLLLVSDGSIEHAMLLLVELEKTIVEGAGAAGLAALLEHRERFTGRDVALVLTGGNVDPLTLSAVIERGLARAGRLARILVDLPDMPGALAGITQVLAEARANVEEVHHRRAFSALSGRSTQVEFVLQTRGPQHNNEIIASLEARGYEARLVGIYGETN